MAYHMGMRRDEILKLTCKEVDLKKGFIRLPSERTKTDSPRNIPIHPEVRATLERLPGDFTQSSYSFDMDNPLTKSNIAFNPHARKRK